MLFTAFLVLSELAYGHFFLFSFHTTKTRQSLGLNESLITAGPSPGTGFINCAILYKKDILKKVAGIGRCLSKRSLFDYFRPLKKNQ